MNTFIPLESVEESVKKKYHTTAKRKDISVVCYAMRSLGERNYHHESITPIGELERFESQSRCTIGSMSVIIGRR